MRRAYRFVLSITPVVADDGSRAEYLFSADHWCTLPTDTPANTPVRGLLKNPGTVRRELFSGQRVTGAITPSWGNIVLANPAPDAHGAGELDDWIDYGLAGADVVLRRGRVGAAYPSGYHDVYRAKCHSFVADSGEITIRLRDDLQLLSQPIVTEGFDGSGGAEGNGSVAKRKQFVSTDPGLIEPILVDAVKNLYFVQSTGTGGLHDNWKSNPTPEVRPFDVFINGVRVDRASSNYASRAEMEANAPSAGQVKFWFGDDCSTAAGWKNGPVYFRLVGSVSGDVRCFAAGYTNDADHAAVGSVVGSFNAITLALRAGVSLANIDTSNVNLGVQSVLVDDSRTFLDVLVDQAQALQGWFGFSRLGKFRSGYLLDPESTSPYYGSTPGLLGTEPAADSTSVYTFTEQAISGLRRDPPSGMDVPAWNVAATAGDTWPSQVAGGASNTLRDYCTRKVWASFSGVAAATKLRDPGAAPSEVKMRARLIQNSFSQRLWLERFFALYGGRRHFFSFTVPMSPEYLALDLHDCVTLQHRRFGLASGKKCRIVSITIDCAATVPSIRFVLWCGTTGRYTGASSGGPTVGSFVDPIPALESIGLFTGAIYGSSSISGLGASGLDEFGADRESIGLFTGSISELANADREFANVALLIGGETSTNDASINTKTVTAVGNAQVSTAQSKFGAGSIAFDGSGDRLTIGAHSDFNFGAGAFTIECFLWMATTSIATFYCRMSGTSGLAYEHAFSIDSTAINFYHGIRGTNQGNVAFFLPSALSSAAWHHVVIQRDGAGDWFAAVDGTPTSTFQEAPLGVSLVPGPVITGTYNNSVNLTSGVSAVDVTVGGSSLGGFFDLNGYINQLRVTNGVARYSGEFTPPSAPFPIG